MTTRSAEKQTPARDQTTGRNQGRKEQQHAAQETPARDQTQEDTREGRE
jgi:hypothetical protein